MDAMNLLDNALLREVVLFAGEGSYLYIALTCRRFDQVYRETYDTRTTSAEELVQTVSGAELFCRETSQESRFRIIRSFFLFNRQNTTRYSPLEFVRDTAALNGRLEVLQWAVARGCPLDERTCTCAATGGNLEVLQWARANGCPWDTPICQWVSMGRHVDVYQWVSDREFED